MQCIKYYYCYSDKNDKDYNAEGDDRENILHREDGPAIEYDNGNKEYWFMGKLHREGGPAIDYANGQKEYYVNYKLHREDGPAFEHADGHKKYYVNDILHREDGPAIIGTNGYEEYWVNGKLHRLDGPAIVYIQDMDLNPDVLSNRAWTILNRKPYSIYAINGRTYPYKQWLKEKEKLNEKAT